MVFFAVSAYLVELCNDHEFGKCHVVSPCTTDLLLKSCSTNSPLCVLFNYLTLLT